jgi:NAD(P)H-dependent FMN reductase
MAGPKIGIIIGTTRENRFGEKPAHWVFDLAKVRNDAEFTLLDLRDYPMPVFNEAMSPAWQPAKNEIAQGWLKKIKALDGFIIVTAEYNHGYPAVLKNALDYGYTEFNRKPVAFVGYGSVGAARSIEQLRLVAVELQMAPVRHGVYVGMVEFLGLMREGKNFSDYPWLGESAKTMIDELIWWTNTLNAGRAAA